MRSVRVKKLCSFFFVVICGEQLQFFYDLRKKTAVAHFVDFYVCYVFLLVDFVICSMYILYIKSYFMQLFGHSCTTLLLAY